jgi:hypothetical protein
MLGAFDTYTEWYGWEAIDAFGQKKKYTTNYRDVPESWMLDHLTKAYPHLKIVSLRRLAIGEVKPPGPGAAVSRHAFQSGLMDQYHRAIGQPLPDDFQILMRRARSIRNAEINADSKLRLKRERFIRQSIRETARSVRVVNPVA